MSALIIEAELSSSLGTEVILSYGFMDDSVAGSDVKLTMKNANGYWFIDMIEVRENCYRGVDEESNRCILVNEAIVYLIPTQSIISMLFCFSDI